MWTDRDSRNGWMKTPRVYELDLRLLKLHDVWSKIDAQLEENCLLLTVGLALARARTERWHEVAWSAAGGGRCRKIRGRRRVRSLAHAGAPSRQLGDRIHLALSRPCTRRLHLRPLSAAASQAR